MKTYRYFASRESDWGVSDELWLPGRQSQSSTHFFAGCRMFSILLPVLRFSAGAGKDRR
jgi:hypothetical protein